MTTVADVLNAVSQMSVDDRMQIAHAIWDSLDEAGLESLTESQRVVIQRRIADLDAHPDNVLTIDQVEALVRRSQ